MRRLETMLEGPILIEPATHGDARGFFRETYRRNVLGELGIGDEFVQDNHSRSQRGVVRGMHFQQGMSKLVSCLRGAIVDVVADVRRGSPAFGRWEAFDLSDENGRQAYVPEGFAHGFCVLSEIADVTYRCSAYYDPELEGGFRYDDPGVGIEWPSLELAVSERDKAGPLLSEIASSLPFSYDG